MRTIAQTCGLILAGGEGLRLRPLTRLIPGDERPKQLCKILGQDTLLEHERPDIVVLLGIAPRSPEPEYGWIEPGPPLSLRGLRWVRRFWEKPAPAVARRLYEFGCLWNSFVMVAQVPTLVTLFRHRLPGLLGAFEEARNSGATEREDIALEGAYGRQAPINFSDDVLSTVPANLAVLPVHGVPWSDWGRPERVFKTLAELGVEPAWARRRAAVAT